MQAGYRPGRGGGRGPAPRVDGRGVARLRAAGVEVTVGVREAEARALNRGFFSAMTEGRPHVTLKSAMTLDGKIAAVDGVSRWITGEAARARGAPPPLRRGRDPGRHRHRAGRRSPADGPAPGPPAEGAAPRRGRQPAAHARRRARPPCGRSGARRGRLCRAGAAGPVAALRARGVHVLELPGDAGRVDLRALLARSARWT